MTLFEVYKGLTFTPKPSRTRALEELKQHLTVLPFQDEEAELGGILHGSLKRKGTSIGEADPIIAATALSFGLSLATGNIAHYQHIVEIGYPLVLEDWRRS